MWKILGLVVLCGLLGYSEGKPYANRGCTRSKEVGKAFGNACVGNDLLLNHLKQIPFSDVTSSGILGIPSGISGLGIVKFDLTNVDEVFVPSTSSIKLYLSCIVEINGYNVLNILNVIKVKVTMTIAVEFGFANFNNGHFDLVIYNCGTTFGPIEVSALGMTLPTSLIDSLKNSIIADINLKICVILKTVFVEVKDIIFGNLNGPLPLGPYGQLLCTLGNLPSVAATYLGLDLFVDLQSIDQTITSIPDSSPSIGVPPLGNFSHAQGFHPGLIDLVLGAFIPKGPIELTCVPENFNGADDLKNAIVAAAAGEFQATVAVSVLSLRISVEGNPTTVFAPEGIFISASIKIEFFIVNSDGSILSVLIVKSNVRLSAAVTFVNGKIIITLSVSGNPLVLISSGVGILDVSTLESHCGNLLGQIFVAPLNVKLAVGIPTPLMFGVGLINPIVNVIEGALVACV